ncbi:MAG TPA: PepSY domain-containing protein [Saliniramus sp.]|nr:PepSY domain-containing protein [Saliniramus sp.]
MKTFLLATTLTVLALPALADDRPPEGSMPLSTIVTQIENEPGFAYFDEIEFDDGVWEIDYYRADGAKVSVDIDPIDGRAR